MRKIYKSILVLALAFIVSAQSFASPVVVKTVTLDPAISTSGFVRVVIKFTDKFVANDIGIIIHEEEAFPSWNGGMGIAGFWMVEGAPQVKGYDGLTPGWNAENVKNFTVGEEVALWFAIDAEQNYHSLSAQAASEANVTSVYSDYTSRSSEKGSPSDNAKYCTVFYNDKDGANTDGCVEIIKDAEIVSSIEPYFTPTATSNIEADSKPIQVYPTLVDRTLSVKASSEVSNVKIYALTGKVVFEAKQENELILSDLPSGTYIISVNTVDGANYNQKIVKK